MEPSFYSQKPCKKLGRFRFSFKWETKWPGSFKLRFLTLFHKFRPLFFDCLIWIKGSPCSRNYQPTPVHIFSCYWTMNYFKSFDLNPHPWCPLPSFLLWVMSGQAKRLLFLKKNEKMKLAKSFRGGLLHSIFHCSLSFTCSQFHQHFIKSIRFRTFFQCIQ